MGLASHSHFQLRSVGGLREQVFRGPTLVRVNLNQLHFVVCMLSNPSSHRTATLSISVILLEIHFRRIVCIGQDH